MLKKQVKTGDKVRAIRDLKAGMKLGDWEVTSNMAQYAGQELTVNEVYADGIISTKETGFFTGWTKEMLEDIQTTKKIRIIVNGNTTVAKMGDEQGFAICNPQYDEFDPKEGTRIAVCRLLGIDPFKAQEEEVVVKDSIDRFSIEEILTELIKRVK